MKQLQRLLYGILNELEFKPPQKTYVSSNSLKEVKALANFCLNEMAEITGRAIGRWRNMAKVSVAEYEKIAYMLAHRYSKCFDADEQEEMFDELKSAGFEGIIQGLTNFNPTKNTKLSTFVYSRAKFAIQKAFAAIKKVKSKGTVSINRAIDEADDESEFGDVVNGCDPAPSVEEIVEKKIRHEALFNAIQKLEEKEQYLVFLCSEYNASQVAKKTNTSVAHINCLLKKVREEVSQAISS